MGLDIYDMFWPMDDYFRPGHDRKKVVYGQAETDALQPGMFDAWRNMWFSGGNPYFSDIHREIQSAYQRAAQEAGALAPGAVGQSIGGDVGRRGGLAASQMAGAMGVAGQQNMLNTAGQAGGYLGALTAARPQYGFESATPWDQFFGGIKTLMEPYSIAASLVQGMPLSDSQPPDPTIKPVAVSPYMRF
jgi:hypothetical protein